MRTITASHRAVVATTVGLVLSLSLDACSQLLAESPREAVGCTLEAIEGDLVAENGRTILKSNQLGSVPLDWPDGWTIRPTDGGELEVVHVMDTVVARTGTRIVLYAESDIGSPLFRDGELVVCPGPVRAPFREADGDVEHAP